MIEKVSAISEASLLKLKNDADFDIDDGLLRMSGNAELYIELILEFSNSYRDTADKFQKLIEDTDKEPARRLVHTVKGVSGGLGIKELYLAAGALEKAVKENRFDQVDSLFVPFRNQLVSALEGVENSGLKESIVVPERGEGDFDAEFAVILLKNFAEHAVSRKPKPAKDSLRELQLLNWPSELRIKLDETSRLAKCFKLKEAAQSAGILINKIKEY
ncbi:MAG: Hpt domain-containing protein [Spirochaetales bacterium]|nr:Hpt domain-containing protein [Spirochaetales bacterium]